MTRQEAFNKVWRHFVVDKGKKSIANNLQCLYRGPGGARCAVGVLIPDREMKRLEAQYPDINDWSVAKIRDEARPAVEALRGLCTEFLEALQFVHDNCREGMFNVTIERRLREFAEDWRLEVPKAAA